VGKAFFRFPIKEADFLQNQVGTPFETIRPRTGQLSKYNTQFSNHLEDDHFENFSQLKNVLIEA